MKGATGPKVDKLASWYAKCRAEGREGWSVDFAPKRWRVDRMLAKPGVPQSGTFLELGCGAGNITLYVAAKGFEAYGIDMTPQAIESRIAEVVTGGRRMVRIYPDIDLIVQM